VFREVRVEYGSGAERQAVLHGVDLEIPAGQSLGLMGRTGSGKTTIKRLATGLLAPTSGRVTLAGADVWSIAPEELSRHLGVVPQEVRLFAASLRQNVTLFASGIPDARVVEVIERVGLADRLLGRPGALDVELHSDGTGLSAGEAQLLALARVFLREPELVVLDEATARIDPETEARLEQVIADVLRDRTSLVIAHRVSTLAHMDRLAVLDDGRVVEHGTRAELLADPGVYARLEALAASDEVVS
jgi:ABC-type multidrug transport system fused ATPase/permease subunit